MRISSEFSKKASTYSLYNTIQNKVIKKLLKDTKSKPKNILDLGCGDGALCKNIDWKYKHFVGVDFAAGMLELHPKSEKIECIYGDFNDYMLFENLMTYRYDHIFSASALQWAEDFDAVIKNICLLDAPISFAIFTSNTFKTLHETAGIISPLRNATEIEHTVKKYFKVDIEQVTYKLEFQSTRDMFRYIKNSGVSASRRILSFRDMKNLMQRYPLDYLEFEVLFIYSR